MLFRSRQLSETQTAAQHAQVISEDNYRKFQQNLTALRVAEQSAEANARGSRNEVVVLQQEQIVANQRWNEMQASLESESRQIHHLRRAEYHSREIAEHEHRKATSALIALAQAETEAQAAGLYARVEARAFSEQRSAASQDGETLREHYLMELQSTVSAVKQYHEENGIAMNTLLTTESELNVKMARDLRNAQITAEMHAHQVQEGHRRFEAVQAELAAASAAAAEIGRAHV